MSPNTLGRGPLVAALFFGGTLLPALGFLNVYPMRYSFVADHFQYLASIGPIALLTATLAFWLQHAPSWVRTLLTAPFLAALALLTHAQCHDYENLETLWRNTLAKNPAAALAHAGLAAIYQARGDADQAAGAALFASEQYDRAAEHYARAIDLQPLAWEAHYNLGIVHMQSGRYAAAVNCFKIATRLEPRDASINDALGYAFIKLHNLPAGLNEFRKVLERDPGSAASRKGIATARRELAERGELDQAITSLREQKRRGEKDRPLQELLSYLGGGNP